MTDWDGAFNLWDLGGIARRDGTVTACGRAFRSGAPEHLTEQGWADARLAGVTTVVDLRNERERVRQPWHPAVGVGSLDGIAVIACPTEDPDDAAFMSVCGPWLDHPHSYADNTAFYPARFAAVFRAIAAAPGAVLIQCAGGRDRTGMVVAMLLALAGAAPEAIGQDYARAFRTASAHAARQAELHPERRHERTFTPEQIEERIAERVPVLIDWIGGFDVAGYLSGAGVSDDELAQLGARLQPRYTSGSR